MNTEACNFLHPRFPIGLLSSIILYHRSGRNSAKYFQEHKVIERKEVGYMQIKLALLSNEHGRISLNLDIFSDSLICNKKFLEPIVFENSCLILYEFHNSVKEIQCIRLRICLEFFRY